MSKCLVMLTKCYPYGVGEEFIENELPVVARKFDRVILIATSVSGSHTPTRPIPKNAEPHAIDARRVLLDVPGPALRFAAFPPKAAFPAAERAAANTFWKRLYFGYLAAKGKAVARAASAVLKDVGLNPSDAVVFYSYWFYDTAVAAVLLRSRSRQAHTRAVSRAHGYDLYPSRSPLCYLPLRPWLLKNLDAVYPCSVSGARLLRKEYPEFAWKVETAYLGTRDYGLGPPNHGKTFHLVSCCHLVPVKRINLLARSLQKLSGSGIRLQWTHVGGGKSFQKLRQYAERNLGFMECRFPGEMENRALMEFYRKTPVDCFVNTSSSEGLPVSVMEACSFGIPILATDVGGTSEIVQDRVNGYLLRPDFEPGDLAGKIRDFCATPAGIRATFRSASRKIWEERFSAETNYEKFARALLL